MSMEITFSLLSWALNKNTNIFSIQLSPKEERSLENIQVTTILHTLKIYTLKIKGLKKKRERERETDRQTDRDREADRQAVTQTEKDRGTQRENMQYYNLRVKG